KQTQRERERERKPLLYLLLPGERDNQRVLIFQIQRATPSLPSCLVSVIPCLTFPHSCAPFISLSLSLSLSLRGWLTVAPSQQREVQAYKPQRKGQMGPSCVCESVCVCVCVSHCAVGQCVCVCVCYSCRCR